jgi:hypothetical protein
MEDICYVLKKDNNEYNIIKRTNKEYINPGLARKLNDVKIKLKKRGQSKFPLFNTQKLIRQYVQYYFIESLNISIKGSYAILSDEIDDKFYIVRFFSDIANYEFVGKVKNLINEHPIKKYKKILYNMVSKKLYEKVTKDEDYCKMERLLYINKLNIILKLYDFLETGGDFLLTFSGFCDFNNIMNIYLILSYMFDTCVIHRHIIIAKKFNPVLRKEDLRSMLDNNYEIKTSLNLTKLKMFMEQYIIYETNLNNMILSNNKEHFFNYFLSEMLLHLKKYSPDLTNINYQQIIISNLQSTNNSPKIFEKEGLYITNLIKKYKLYECLEVGMSYGIYSYYILSNDNVKLSSIDTYQQVKWNNKGIGLLEEFNLNDRHTLYTEKAYIKLPYLVENKLKKYDLIFIQTNLSSVYVINEFFYSSLLLKTGGYIVMFNSFDTLSSNVLEFIENNHELEKIQSPNNLAVYKKNKIDKRESIIDYYDEINSAVLMDTKNTISTHNSTSDFSGLTKEYDWLLKKKNSTFNTKVYNTSSWKRTAFEILTNPKFKPNIQALNKNIEYIGDGGPINTLNSEFPEQVLCEKYILSTDCVLEIGSRYGTVSNIINIKLQNKTDQVSIDADISIKKYHELNKHQYVSSFIKNQKISNTYSSFFGMIDNSDTQFYLIKTPYTYGNNVVSLDNLKDDHLMITNFGEKKFKNVKHNENKLQKYALDKIAYEDIQKTFELSKPINALVLDCEGCALIIIKQILKAKMLDDLEIIIVELDVAESCNYVELDNLLTTNNFKLHVCVWYNAIYLKQSRLDKYNMISETYFHDEWWDNLIEINTDIPIWKKYNKKYNKK